MKEKKINKLNIDDKFARNQFYTNNILINKARMKYKKTRDECK